MLKIPDGPDNRIFWFKDEIPDKLLMSFFSMCMSFLSMSMNAADKSTLFVFGLQEMGTGDQINNQKKGDPSKYRKQLCLKISLQD